MASKKNYGRGRGKSYNKPEGPWSRSKKLDETHEVRPPKKDDKEFLLTESSFPPLPGTPETDDKFGDNEPAAPTVVNNRVTTDKPENKCSKPLPSTHPSGPGPKETTPKGDQVTLQNGNVEQETEPTSNNCEEGGKVVLQNGNVTQETEATSMKCAKGGQVLLQNGNVTQETETTSKKCEKDKSDVSHWFADVTTGDGVKKEEDVDEDNIDEENTNGDNTDVDKTDVENNHVENATKDNPGVENTGTGVENTGTGVENTGTGVENTGVENIDILNSNLSPFAPEFIPKGINMNPQAEDIFPVPDGDELNPAKPKTRMRSSVEHINVNDTAALLSCLEDTVTFCYSRLTETPAEYDEVMGVVTPHYLKYMENPVLPHEIVQCLYSFAIQDTSFSYFAVKILVYLIKITCAEEKTELRDTLLRHMQLEIKLTETERMPDSNVNCSNVIQPVLMFMSEIYIQLEVGEKRLPMIGFTLVETLKKLLASTHIPIKERLKLIVNMVKLTGISLDEDNTAFLDGLITDLHVALEQEQSNLDSPTIQMVNDVILLRRLRWGFIEPEVEACLKNTESDPSPPDCNEVYPQSDVYDPAWKVNTPSTSGVFYGPDGLPIGQEEQLFLEVESNAMSHLQVGDQDEISPNSSEVYDEGYDEAYEEFLKTIPGYNPYQ